MNNISYVNGFWLNFDQIPTGISYLWALLLIFVVILATCGNILVLWVYGR